MAGASDKARFYLEQSVPSLQEAARKGIFTPDEIRSIAAKRSDFEHSINARGSLPADYARYATYETNLDALRKKRCKRLRIKSTTHTGQRNVFFVLERATTKFPGDMGLWMQYVEFCQRQRAGKKLARVFTKVLRLRPREWGLWVLAAKYYAETQGDISTARSYMQRGLRFCKDERRLWGEYLRLEMVYLAKLAARRKILGLGEGEKDQKVVTDRDDEPMEDEEGQGASPTQPVTAGDIAPDTRKGIDDVDDDALKKLAATPAFTGAIPIAIFDAAYKQFNNDPKFAELAFDLCVEFDKTPSTERILQHILSQLQASSPGSVESVICGSKMSLFRCPVDSEEFPPALGVALVMVKKAASGLDPKRVPWLAEKAVLLLLPYLRIRDDLDEDIVTVLEASVRRYLKVLPSRDVTIRRSSPTLATLFDRLRKEGRDADIGILEIYSVSQSKQ